MAILHGSWLPQENYFFVWGEIWRKLDLDSCLKSDQTLLYPFAMTQVELAALVESGGGELDGQRVSAADVFKWPLPAALMTAKAVGQKSSTGRSRKRQAPVEDLAVTPPSGPNQKTQKHLTRWCSQVLALPTQMTDTAVIPQLAANSETDAPVYLYPWQINGIYLAPQEAMAFLNSLPL
ncbi:MAG: hypothetical protein F6K19_39605, partial [Cyanothece sp. SIO1E1]|nr:hypothetical protein [Cyanothece sp. SIO1E1]